MQKNTINPSLNAIHNIIMENRKTMRISGVKDIDGLTESRIVLSTVMGELVIKGEELHIGSLEGESGELTLTGEINSLAYSRHSVMDGPVKKFFR